MQQVQSSDTRGFNKRHYSSPDSGIFLKQKTSFQAISIPKPPQFRRTDYTDEQNSSAANSQINHIYKHSYNPQNYNTDRFPTNQENRHRRYDKERIQNEMYEQLKQKQSKLVQLRQRLKNIHHFYKIKIEEERSKNIERSQIFIGLMQQLQIIQNQKLANIQRNYDQIQQGQKEAGMVDERMSNLNKQVQQIVSQSQQIKSQNQSLYTEIASKHQSNKLKQIQLANIKQQLHTLREQLQTNQKIKLKQHRRSKDLLQMINNHIFQ